MRILLFGNPSTLHSNLAKGLRELGHEVRCISHGTGWRRFPIDDICLERRTDINGKLAFLDYLFHALPILHKCKGYDIVQLSSPLFLELRGTQLKPFYEYLRRHNRKIIMGSFGDDYHFVDQMLHGNVMRYNDQVINGVIRQDAAAREQREEWLHDSRHEVGISKYVAQECDAIVACAYDYWVCYNKVYPEKLHYVPMPIVMEHDEATPMPVGKKVKLFVGIQRERMQYKGVDLMLRAAERVQRDYPDRVELRTVENVPYLEYKQTMEGSDAIIDQLYSYSPGMNSLLAMSKGIVSIGGGEPECYAAVCEEALRPIVNVVPDEEQIYQVIKDFVLHPEHIDQMKRDSVEYVRRHHDYLKVARQYEAIYRQLLM